MKRNDLIGKIFGRITVVAFSESRKGRPYWKCKCLCGRETVVAGYSLTRGYTKSCGCLHDEMARDQFKKISGKEYGKLTVTDEWRREVKNGQSNIMWLCKCDCGKQKWIYSKYLLCGDTKSCGCLRVSCGATHAHLLHLPPGIGAKRFLYQNYISGSRRRGLRFELEIDYFIQLTSSNCFYCGAPPGNQSCNNKLKKNGSQRHNGSYIYNGIDRVDNTKGYVLGNCVPCCINCNKAKASMIQEEFYNWIKKIYTNLFRSVQK